MIDPTQQAAAYGFMAGAAATVTIIIFWAKWYAGRIDGAGYTEREVEYNRRAKTAKPASRSKP